MLEQEPLLVVGSPMCAAFSTWQYLNAHRADPEELRRAWSQALVHMRFACEIYQMQIDAGRYFLHEHPAYATSWHQECVKTILAQSGVDTVINDQCQFGQRDAQGNPIRKPTRWMSNADAVLKSLGRRCTGRRGECSMGGQHALCSGSRAKAAAIYPFALCKAILQGIRNQLRIDHRLQEGIYGLMSPADLQKWMENDDDALENSQARDASDYDQLNAVYKQGEAVIKDALTGQALDSKLVKIARQAELDYFESKNVWFKRPRAESFQKMGKAPITVKWVDVNKGDTENPNYRSRLVAREIRKPWEDTIFAPTPPLESLRTVLSMAATDLEGDELHVRDATAPNRTQVMVLDISRAYFNAKRDPDVDPTYVELPDEDPLKSQGMCAQLRVHMYGTRAAAEGWHSEYSSTMESMGFMRGDASACVFRHPTKRLVASVHGDDFTVAGPKDLLDWMKSEMQKKYELTETGRIGPAPSDGKEVKVLNRVVRWTTEGLEYEGDPRQSERFVRDLKLEGTKRVGTPGVKQVMEQIQQDKELPSAKHTAFRAATARGKYISADRPEIQYATKEICRWMSAPLELGVKALKRLGGIWRPINV